MIRYLKTVFTHKLFKNASVYTAFNTIKLSVPFLLLPVMTRYLTPSDYGILSIFYVLTPIMVMCIGLNTRGAVSVNFFKMNKKSLSNYIGGVLYITAISFIITFVLIYIFKAPLSQLIKFPQSWLLVVIPLALANFILALMPTLWQAEQKPLPYGIFQVSQITLNVGLSLFFVIGVGLEWRGRIISMLISAGIFAAISLFIMYRRNYIDLSFNKKYIKDALFFGIPLIPYALGGWIKTSIDRIFISSMISTSATGLYTVGYQVGALIGFLATSFNLAWSPFLFQKLKENSYLAKVRIVKFTYLYFAGIIALALLLSFVAPSFLKFFVGGEFQSSYQYVIWIALGYAAQGMYYMVTGYIIFMKKTYLLSATTLFGAGINVVLNYFFIKINGAIGAAQATAISFFLSFVFAWILSARVYKMPWSLRSADKAVLEGAY